MAFDYNLLDIDFEVTQYFVNTKDGCECIVVVDCSYDELGDTFKNFEQSLQVND